MPDQTTQITGDVMTFSIGVFRAASAHEWVFDIRQAGSKVWLTPRPSISAGGASHPNRPIDPPFVEIEFDFDALIKALDPHIHRALEKQVKEDGVGF